MSGPTWSKVPREAFEDDRLSRLQLRVLGILASHADAKGFCTRRQEAIADETGVKRESVNRAIARLVALGYVERIQRAGMKRSLKYRVVIADGARGQLSLFDRAETPRSAKAEERLPRCDRSVTTDVTPEITSVVTPEVTAINEQPPVNRSYAGRERECADRNEPGDAARPAEPGSGMERSSVGDLDEIEVRLREAGQGAIDETSPGLFVLSEPIGWLAAGCDLDADILPTIRGLAARSRASPRGVRSRGRLIRAWSYFTAAVLEARDRRLAAARTEAPPATNSNVVPLRPGGSHAPSFSAADHIARRRAQLAGR